MGKETKQSKRFKLPSKISVTKTKKSKKVPVKVYNPKFKIKQYKVIRNDGKEITINVIRDDYLIGGTKQRAMIPFFENDKSLEYVYVSPFTGAAQISLAYSAKLTNKRSVVYMIKQRPRHPLTNKALKIANYDSNVFKLIEIPNTNMKRLNKIAEKYVEETNKKKGENYAIKIGLGFSDEAYHNLLVDNLKKAVPASLKKNPPKRFWIPSGSSIMLNAMYQVFPDTYFLAVQTGKTIWDDQYDKSKTTLYKSEEFFYNKAKVQPPYPTTQAYDAKAWKFVKEHGEDGDFILNITNENY